MNQYKGLSLGACLALLTVKFDRYECLVYVHNQLVPVDYLLK